jgi:hypothetical protein
LRTAALIELLMYGLASERFWLQLAWAESYSHGLAGEIWLLGPKHTITPRFQFTEPCNAKISRTKKTSMKLDAFPENFNESMTHFKFI